eukprot:1186612-Prorocentrum_minimum.AAC.5
MGTQPVDELERCACEAWATDGAEGYWAARQKYWCVRGSRGGQEGVKRGSRAGQEGRPPTARRATGRQGRSTGATGSQDWAKRGSRG